MIRNANYVMSLIDDPTGRAKKAQVGVDLTVKGIKKIEGDHDDQVGWVFNDESGEKARYGTYTPLSLYEVEGHNVYILYPGCYSIEFEQGLKPLPEDNTAFIYHRSTLGRNGALIRSAVYDPGFTTPTMGAVLEVWRKIKIEEHARIAQIVIYTNEKAELYNGSYQGAKDIK